jgi:hypothetical protein
MSGCIYYDWSVTQNIASATLGKSMLLIEEGVRGETHAHQTQPQTQAKPARAWYAAFYSVACDPSSSYGCKASGSGVEIFVRSLVAVGRNQNPGVVHERCWAVAVTPQGSPIFPLLGLV